MVGGRGLGVVLLWMHVSWVSVELVSYRTEQISMSSDVDCVDPGKVEPFLSDASTLDLRETGTSIGTRDSCIGDTISRSLVT